MFDPVSAVIGGGLGLVGSIFGGSQQADAATDAANIQANSANQANQLQYQMFQEQQKLMQPWVQSGQNNLDRLNYAMYGQVPQQQQQQQLGPAPVAPVMPEFGNLYIDGGGDTGRILNPNFDMGGSIEKYNQDLAKYYQDLAAYNAQGSGSPVGGGLTVDQMGVKAGGLNPDWRFSTQDWKNSPEYEVYAGARDAALTRSQDALMAQGAASGMYGSGTMANALSQNMGQLYAQYDPLSLQTAQQNAVAARQNQYNQMVGMASPTGAQQVGQWAGQYGANAGQNIIGAGNAQAAGQVGAANAWGNAMSSGVNQLANAYGQYQGQQNFNRWNQPQQWQVPISSGYNPGGTYETYGWD